MPDCLQRSYDPMAHATVADLVRLATHELDLYTEGEESDIRTSFDEKRVRDYLRSLARDVAMDEQRCGASCRVPANDDHSKCRVVV